MRKQKQTPGNEGLRYCTRFISDCAIRISFVIRHSDFVISF
jgi:hypothetical protein